MSHQPTVPAALESAVPDHKLHAMIRRELVRIQDSRAFCNSSRAKDFLSYVIENALQGHTELLKERSIGVNVFHREATYVTADDAIVRVKAAEVRKRLTQYYAEEEQASELRIELPVGTYIPKFHWRSSPDRPPAQSPVVEPVVRSKRHWWAMAAAAALLALIALALPTAMRKHVHPRSQIDEFWGPVFTTEQPVLICLSSPVLYYPDRSLYMGAIPSHPGLYDSSVQRALNPLQLEPTRRLEWKDIEPRVNTFVHKAHVYDVALLSALFERIHKTSQVKIGSDYSYNDLQNSPAILLGAFDNPWSVRMTAELPFYFHDQDDTIVEREGQHRVWSTGPGPTNPKDFAIVARLLNSKTGQFLVILGGISEPGTEAAGKLVSRQDIFNDALRSAPAGWQDKNIEFVIETDRIGDSDSSMRVLGVKTW